MPPIAVVTGVPDPSLLDRVRALVAAVTAEDGRAPLSDQALTRLGAPGVEHATALDGDRVVGYAQLDGRSLEVAAETAAIAPLLAAFAGRPTLVWTHGRHSRLTAVLAGHGFTRARELHQLRRATAEPLPERPLPDGVRLTGFTVGRDEAAWLRLNAAAFAHHPEQGRWTSADLAAREREPWFDPDGFLLARRDGALVGFHWTKVHPDGAGEVYVIGVDPAAQGSGLGAALLVRGLALLRERGCPEVLLYVDGDNAPALALYERFGFVRHDLDVQWAAPADQSSSTGSESKT